MASANGGRHFDLGFPIVKFVGPIPTRFLSSLEIPRSLRLVPCDFMCWLKLSDRENLLGTSGDGAFIRLFTSVDAHMPTQMLSALERLTAAVKTARELSRLQSVDRVRRTKIGV